MPLSVGEKLGPYEILAPIGAGGMGEVYRAKDTKLEREVAIKVLPAALAQDRERLARFEREAKVLASLNHPNIAQIYGLEESSSGRALVMELVPGQTLQSLLPQDQAQRIAVQIAEALEAAHEKGIIHRDLKPANIMITPTGVVKVLDFGLAAMPQRPTDGDPTNSPTLTMQATQAGMIMGTAGYMSPEQAAGQMVDKRADIWSFGVVLWEMLVGQRMFTGSTVAHILADVLRAPVDLDKLPKETPRAVRDLLKRCLERDVKTRLRDIGEARIVIQNLGKEPDLAVGAVASKSSSGRLPWMAATAAATIVAALAAWAWWRQPALEPALPMRFSLDAPPDTEFRSLYFSSAISPDGRLLVFSAQKKGDATTPTLWLRDMNSFTSRELPGTENGNGPFWSPDSKSIGFQADGKLKRIDVAGGSVQALCDATDLGFEGGSWNQEGVVLFGQAAGGIQRVSASGGAPVPVTVLAREGATPAGAISHRYPHFLPDGRTFLYTQAGALDNSGIYVASLDSPNQAVRLLQTDAKAVYAPPRNEFPGYLLWLRDQTLVAQRFNSKSRRLEGEPLVVADGIAAGFAANARRAAYSLSTTGLLAYRGGGNAGFDLTWVNRDGKPEASTGSASFQRGGDPSISPDGRRVAMERQTGNSMQVWLSIQAFPGSRFGRRTGSKWPTARIEAQPGDSTARTRAVGARRNCYSVEATPEQLPAVGAGTGVISFIKAETNKFTATWSTNLIFSSCRSPGARRSGSPSPICKLRSGKPMPSFRRMGSGWPTNPTNRDGRRCTFRRFLPPARSGKSRTMEASSHAGAEMAGNCSSSATRPKGCGLRESGLPRPASKSRCPGRSSRFCFSPDHRSCTTSHPTASAS